MSGKMQYNVALDMGTSGVRMALKGHGVIYQQSSAIAMRGGEMLATGNEALRLLARTPAEIAVRFPMLSGTVADEQALFSWLKYLVRYAQMGGQRGKPKLLFSVPPKIQPAPLRHLLALAMEAGAGSCAAVGSDLAAGIGAPVDIHATKCAMICQLGAGMIGVSAICAGRVVYARTLPFGMALLDEAIVRQMRKKYGMMISAKGAEELKLLLCNANGASAPSVNMAALDGKTGFPREFSVQSEDLKDAAASILDQFCQLIDQVLLALPEQMSADVGEGGLVLCGGGAQLFGLAQRIADEFSLACHLVEDPAASTIRGLSKMIESKDKYDELVMEQQRILRQDT